MTPIDTNRICEPQNESIVGGAEIPEFWNVFEMNYTSYRIIGIDITRFQKKVHFEKN